MLAQPTRLATILAACGDGTELIGCVVDTRDFDSRAHAILLRGESPLLGERIVLRGCWEHVT